MRATFLAAAAAFTAQVTYAQLAGSEDGPNNGTESGGTPTAQDGNRTIHYVNAAKGGHFYQPNSIQAEVGDIVTFQFYPTNHSVIRAAYLYPCIPYERIATDGEGEGFDSGFFSSTEISDTPQTWNLTVNSTEPIFYYCGAPGSCDDWGMVGVINANASQDITNQIRLAKDADYVVLPGEDFPDEAIQSMSEMAATATATVTQAEAPTSNAGAAASATQSSEHNHSSSGLSGGAIAGIVVGGVAAIAILAALFFLLGRTKSMKKRLDEREQQNDPARQSMPPPAWMPQNGQYFNPNNPHMSAQLPPYGHPDHGFYEQKPHDETVSLANGPMSPPLRAQSPPVSEMGQHSMPGFQSAPYDPHGNFGFAHTSELSGSSPMAAEIYTPAKNGSPTTDHPAYKP